MKILVTGSAGFIAGYLVERLLNQGHAVIGIDNFSKYGKIQKTYDSHPNYFFVEGDAKNPVLMKELVADADHFVSGAAMIGGISYFHKFAYDLIAENERISAASFDSAIWAFKNKKLRKITVLSSSMVYEASEAFPSKEEDVKNIPPPLSTYGFQKLACEYFAQGAYEQYGLPFTIVRPFNCVGIGETKALFCQENPDKGNRSLALSHVVPDLIIKMLKGLNPLPILGSGRQIRHYTHGTEVARGIQLAMESSGTSNEVFNISDSMPLTVIELAEKIWDKINPGTDLSFQHDPPFQFDVQKRQPDINKAKDKLGFECHGSIDRALEEVIPWIQRELDAGRI